MTSPSSRSAPEIAHPIFNGRGAALLAVVLSSLCSASAWAAEIVSARPIDLVGDDVALVCEIDQPKSAWNDLQNSELFQRWQRSIIFQQWQTSRGYQRWEDIERKTVERTGATLSAQLLDLCAQELVLAVYLSPDKQPEGVFLARAENANAPACLLQTWQELETKGVVETLTHKGREYFRRQKSSDKSPILFYATFDRLFVLSDHENRIRQVLELLPEEQPRAPGNAGEPRRFQRRIAAEPEAPLSPVRLYLPARAWDSVWRDAPAGDQGLAILRRWWPAIDALTVDVDQRQGLTVQARVHLNAEKTDEDWRDWCAPTPQPHRFLNTIPQNAFLVAAGGVNILPLINLLHDLTSERERNEWQKARRVVRGLLGGHDPLDDVLPALTQEVGLALVSAAAAEKHDVPFDAVLTCRFSAAAQAAGLHLALDPALSAGLMLLSADCAEKHASDEPPVVHSEVMEGKTRRWLETARPIRVAYQLTPDSLVISRSIELLRQQLSENTNAGGKTIFPQLAATKFPDASQFLCIDVRKYRESQDQNQGSPGPEPSSHFASWEPWLELCDAAYLASRFEPARVTIRLGVLADPQP